MFLYEGLIRKERMDAVETPFSTFKSNVRDKEGIVCLGAGGDPKEWIEGVSKVLNDEQIVTGQPDQIWTNIYKLQTTGGRTDLAFVFKPEANFNIGKMAIWRIKFGDCSWISDYLDNYKKHFQRNPDGTPCE
jgi:hypothetical protein